MVKCRYCGAESHSHIDQCPFMRDVGTRSTSNRRRNLGFILALTSGAILLLLGMALAIGGVLKATPEGPQEGEVNWESVASFGVFMASAGLGVMIYSLSSVKQPLWMVREGRRSRSRLAVILMSFGVMTIAFNQGHIVISVILDKAIGSGTVHLLMLSVSLLLIVAGYLERPSLIFGADRWEYITRRTRIAVGVCLILAGVLSCGGGLAYALSQGTSSSVALVLWMILSGFILAIGGLGMIFPSGRWWMSRGVLEES